MDDKTGQEPAPPDATVNAITQHEVHVARSLGVLGFDPDALERVRRRTLAADWARLGDLDRARSLRARCPVPGASDGDYLPRVVRTREGLLALVQVRFAEGDPSHPFVRVVARSGALTSATQMRSLAGSVAAELAALAPRELELLTTATEALDAEVLLATAADLHLVAGDLESLRALAPPPDLDRLVLRAAGDLAFYPVYKEMYAELHRTQPRLRVVRRETEESLRSSLEEGTLFEVLVDGAFAGVAAVRRSDAVFLHGFGFVEEILAAGVRGRGLGPVLQRRLVETLSGRRGDALFGTIAEVNTASLRTARRAGRSVVATWRRVGL